MAYYSTSSYYQQTTGWEHDSTAPPPNHYDVESEYHHLCNISGIFWLHHYTVGESGDESSVFVYVGVEKLYWPKLQVYCVYSSACGMLLLLCMFFAAARGTLTQSLKVKTNSIIVIKTINSMRGGT